MSVDVLADVPAISDVVAALQHDLVLHAERVRELLDLGEVEAGHGRRRRDRDAGRAAADDASRLGAEHARDDVGGDALQLGHLDQVRHERGHRREDLGATGCTPVVSVPDASTIRLSP